MSEASSVSRFDELELAEPILRAIQEVGYETPSPIQAASIPHLLAGEDVLGQAQTGTGKTAAFALPLLSKLDLSQSAPQVLILAPTRELALQVAEACQKYARYLPGFHVLPIYGGQAYGNQLRQLKRGVHVVVGTPGRVMDHMRRGTLQLDQLKALVLDEADEMLRMGFIDDVEWILEQTPQSRQIALFSATMPTAIQKIARQHLESPQEVKIKVKTTTADTISQRFWLVSGLHKLDALTRILEVEPFDGMIIFVRTKMSTEELAEKLEARGYAAAALNGDIPQKLRERTVDKLKRGQIDILIATDVAARGLDVERISHVVNYDIPHDTEAYVHRIGRTGRAGREGNAILFVAPRERYLLRAIERATKNKIDPMNMPSTSEINSQRMERFKERISEHFESAEYDMFYQLIESYAEKEPDKDPMAIAAALACMAQGDRPLLLAEPPPRPAREYNDRDGGKPGGRNKKPRGPKGASDVKMERFRINVGRDHGVKPGNIVGAIANEAEINSRYIGQIELYGDYSTVDLPVGMPKETLQLLKRTRVCNRPLELSRMGGDKRSKPRKPKD